ncbi:MAG: ribosome assembly cofactor RimP [Nonlabens sp.]
MLKDKVQELLDSAFEERSDLFLIDFKIGSANDIHVTIDGDEGVKLADCMFVSRAVEHNLDREEIDFSIEVTSSGASAPLERPRQYYKHVGRTLEIEDLDGRVEKGELGRVQEEGIALSWKAREPKPIGKGKVTVEKNWELNFDQIKKAKVIITFN